MESHGSPHGNQLTPDRPNFLRTRLRKGQVVAPDQLELHKLKGVRVVVVLVPSQSGPHDIIVLGAQLVVRAFRRDRRGKGGQEFMTEWEVADNEGGQYSNGG